MILSNFNEDFRGFNQNEDLFLDTCVVLALLNEFDAWHYTVRNLFDTYIFNAPVTVSLHVHSSIINEVTHLADKPLDKYMDCFNFGLSQKDIKDAINSTIDGIYQLIEQDIVNLLTDEKDIVLKQVRYSRQIGSVDAIIASLVDYYGISLITLDNKLIANLNEHKISFPNIQHIYYTTAAYRSY